MERGIPMYSYDLRGHGRSGTLLGHIENFDSHASDLLQVASWVKHIEQREPPIIVGHGIGALIAIQFAKKFGDSCAGLVLAAPSFELKDSLQGVGRFFLKLLSDLWPTCRLPLELYPRGLHGLDLPRLTASYLNEVFHAMERQGSPFSNYHGEVLIICPEQDQFCHYQLIKKAVALHQEYNLTMLDVPGEHRIFEEENPHLPMVMNVLWDWLEKIESTLRNIRQDKPAKIVRDRINISLATET
jgi:pimeloyl-ACP methyl ester carboxylesterase